jgi:hypothetical protein
MRMQPNSDSSHIRVIVLIDAKEGNKQEIMNLLVPLVDPQEKEREISHTPLTIPLKILMNCCLIRSGTAKNPMMGTIKVMIL